MSIQGTPTSGIRWLIDSTGAIVGYRNPVSDQDAEAMLGVNTDYTLAQLESLALAGGLTPYATYIPSDADPAYQLWARSASEFGSTMGGDVVQVQIAGSVGATIEVSP